MGKPEDISDEVWSEAKAAAGGWMAAGESESNAALIESVARAILAAEKRGEERERERAKDMADCLSDMTEHYVALVNSGDAGFWNAEEEIEVQAARQMIVAIRNGGAS
jgi:hypothetical protein